MHQPRQDPVLELQFPDGRQVLDIVPRPAPVSLETGSSTVQKTGSRGNGPVQPSPLAGQSGYPRHRIVGRPLPTDYDVYFGIYQSLWSEDDEGQRLYQAFPPDFVDLVIIDECHRSGWGSWRNHAGTVRAT